MPEDKKTTEETPVKQKPPVRKTAKEAPAPEKPAEKPDDPLVAVSAFAESAGLFDWETAGMVRFAGWTPDKRVTAEEFNDALKQFRKRPMGGGRRG